MVQKKDPIPAKNAMLWKFQPHHFSDFIL